MGNSYFKTPGKENTEKVLEIAKKYTEENNIQSIVVASTTGSTAKRAAEMFSDRNLVIVTHSTGFSKPNHQEFPEGLKVELESKGVKSRY